MVEDTLRMRIERILPLGIVLLLTVIIILIPFYARWGNIGLIALGAASLLNSIYRKQMNFPPTFIYFLMATYAVRILWIVGTNDFLYGLRTLETELPLLSVPLIFIFFKLTNGATQFLGRVYVIMVLSIVVFSFFKLYSHFENSGQTVKEYLEMHFVTAQYYAQLNMLTWNSAHYSFLSVMIIYGLHILFNDGKKGLSYFIFLGIYVISSLAFFIFTGSKSGMALLIIAFAAYIFIKFRKILLSRYAMILGLCLAFFSVIYLFRFNVKDYLYKSDSQRYQFFTVSVEAWMQKPLLGYGTGSSKAIIQDMDFAEKIGFSKTEYEGNRANHPHNQYLSELLQFGFVGSIPLILFLVGAFLYSIKHENWILLNIMITFSLFMLVESPINSNKGLVPFVLLTCLYAYKKDEP